MKTSNFLFAILCVSALTFTSCSSNEDMATPAQQISMNFYQKDKDTMKGFHFSVSQQQGAEFVEKVNFYRNSTSYGSLIDPDCPDRWFGSSSFIAGTVITAEVSLTDGSTVEEKLILE